MNHGVSGNSQRRRYRRKRTCSVEPRLDDQPVHRLGINHLGKTRRIEVARARVHSDLFQIDIRFHSREADVTQPERVQSELAVRMTGIVHIPLLLDHLQKVSVVDNSFKHGPKREAIMSAERRRKANDWDSMRDERRCEF